MRNLYRTLKAAPQPLSLNGPQDSLGPVTLLPSMETLDPQTAHPRATHFPFIGLNLCTERV